MTLPQQFNAHLILGPLNSYFIITSYLQLVNHLELLAVFLKLYWLRSVPHLGDDTGDNVPYNSLVSPINCYNITRPDHDVIHYGAAQELLILQLHQAPHHLLSLHQQVYQLLKIRAPRRGRLRWATSIYHFLIIYSEKTYYFHNLEVSRTNTQDSRSKVNIKKRDYSYSLKLIFKY